MNDPNSKFDLLKTYTTNRSVIEELITYTENKFLNRRCGSTKPDEEASIQVWEDYQEQSKELGVFEVLRQNLVQLQFPILKNISQSPEYRSANLKGVSTKNLISASGLVLENYVGLELFIYQSFAGSIPVIIVSNDEDFKALIQALTYRNEPVKIPDSMGAAMINGLNNWDRIRRLKAKWLKDNPLGNWGIQFVTNILPNKNLYQDKLIILSKKPYSNVSAKAMGLSQEEWLEHSLKIRLEHECTHLFTLNSFGHMANNMHDELIADYMGITNTLGKFKSDWFLRFIGLENYPKYRQGGRLQNYVRNPDLSNQAIIILRALLKKAAINLEVFNDSLGLLISEEVRIRRLMSICSLDLLELSMDDAKKKLLNRYDGFCSVAV